MPSCLSRVPIFQSLSSAEQEQVHDYIVPKNYKKGERVQLAGDYHPNLFILNRGSAKVSRTTSDGDEQVVRLLEPGDYIGEISVFAKTAAGYDVVATEDSVFCTLGDEKLDEILRSYPSLGLKILADMSRRLERAEAHIESLGLHGADERLLEALQDYANGRQTFELTVPKKTLAAQIGVRPETLSRSLKRLEGKGLIRHQGKSISFLAVTGHGL